MRKKLIWPVIMIGLITITGLAMAKNQKTITIATLMRSRYLDAAITAFQSKHPDINVQLNTFGNGSDLDVERYVKTTTTTLMAGKGADIISLNYLPYQKLASRNVLVNLSVLSARDKSFDARKYYANIFNACKYKNSLYGLPVSFRFDAVMVNQEAINQAKLKINDSNWTWQDFAEIAARVTKDTNGDGKPEQFALPNMDRLYLFDFMFRYQYNRFVDPVQKVARFNSAEFIALLKLCKSFSDRRLMVTETGSDPVAEIQAMANTVTFIPIQMNSYGNYTFYVTCGQSVMSISGGKWKSVFAGKFQFISLPGNGKSSSLSIPSDMFLAINRSSKNQSEAWEFLKYLLSNEMQVSRSLPGMAVNKEAQAQKPIIERDWQKANGIKNPLSQAEIDRINQLIGNLGYLNSIDLQVDQIIHNEILPFFSGLKSAEAVSKLIQGKVETYLRE